MHPAWCVATRCMASDSSSWKATRRTFKSLTMKLGWLEWECTRQRVIKIIVETLSRFSSDNAQVIFSHMDQNWAENFVYFRLQFLTWVYLLYHKLCWRKPESDQRDDDTFVTTPNIYIRDRIAVNVCTVVTDVPFALDLGSKVPCGAWSGDLAITIRDLASHRSWLLVSWIKIVWSLTLRNRHLVINRSESILKPMDTCRETED